MGARQRLPPAELAAAALCCSAASRASTARGGERKYAEDALKIGQIARRQAGAVLRAGPPSLYDGRIFPYPRKGEAPLRPAPRGNAGNPPAADPDPND